MGDLSDRDVEDVLEGVQPPGRDDFAHVVELTTWLHASREIEPPPAMRDDLFTQIEAGLGPSHRSSRRAPAHLRHHGPGTRRPVRRALAGSGRPLVSVAAAAILLVGVILAVRAGGPDREPSAFVSPSAQSGSRTGADEPTTTAVPTTMVPPTEATEPPGSADTGLADDVPSTTTDGGSRRWPASSGASSTDRASRRGADANPPTTDRLRRTSDDDDQATAENPSSLSRSQQSSERSTLTSETGRRREHPSGWDFDLSEWPWARQVWDAVGPDGDVPNGADGNRGRERRDAEREHGALRDGVSDDGDAGDNESGGAPRG
jgi:hypothetical protein